MEFALLIAKYYATGLLMVSLAVAIPLILAFLLVMIWPRKDGTRGMDSFDPRRFVP